MCICAYSYNVCMVLSCKVWVISVVKGHCDMVKDRVFLYQAGLFFKCALLVGGHGVPRVEDTIRYRSARCLGDGACKKCFIFMMCADYAWHFMCAHGVPLSSVLSS